MKMFLLGDFMLLCVYELILYACVYHLHVGSSIMGYEVQIGWGKSVPLPPKPYYVSNTEKEEKNLISDSQSGTCTQIYVYLHQYCLYCTCRSSF